MKALRFGAILLTIGISLSLATIMRNRTLSTGVQSHPIGLVGPLLLEPRETVVVLRDVSPEWNLTLSLVNAQDWTPPQNFEEADAKALESVSTFEVTGLKKFDTVIFTVDIRGLYYVLTTISTGEFTDETELVVEQRGMANDMWWASLVLLASGIVVVIGDRVNTLRRVHRK
jgi:hypothetical protein